MTGIVELTGIIIKSVPVGEYDKRITILTKERGKIGAFARGARRSGNIMMGYSRTFSYGKFFLYEGRDSYNLQSAEIVNYFDEITNDLESACYGSYFLEFADYYTREGLPDAECLSLVYLSLKALTKERIPRRLVRRIFELRIMVINGEYDVLPDALSDNTSIYTWSYIISSPVEKLYTFVITENALAEIEKALDKMISKYIDRQMKSLRLLEDII